MLEILVLRNKATMWSPHGIYARALGSLRARCRRCAIGRSFETDDEYKQHLAQRHKQQETLRGIVNEIAASVRVQSASESRLSGVRRLPSKQPPKRPPPRQNVVEAVRQRAAAEQWLTALKQRASRVCTASVHVMCRVDTAYNKSVWRSSYDVCVYV